LVPGFAAVVRALNDLPEPAAGLRRVQPVRVSGRAFQVVDLPAAEEGTADVPAPALAVGCQDERTLTGADQDSYAAHVILPVAVSEMLVGDHLTHLSVLP